MKNAKTKKRSNSYGQQERFQNASPFKATTEANRQGERNEILQSAIAKLPPPAANKRRKLRNLVTTSC